MKTVEVDVAPQVNVTLQPETRNLDEVLVTAPYSTKRKSDFTGSAGVVSSKTLEKSLVSNVTNALQGTVPGLQSFSSRDSRERMPQSTSVA